MSEYQYYEFLAIDRPLSEDEMSVLRSFSTRARITPTSFVNEYSWGSFKGDEDAWMERYFDAFLYVANWGTCVLKLALPAGLLGRDEVAPYLGGDALSGREANGRLILTFASGDEEGGEWVEAEGILSSLVGVRAGLAAGDRRALYLGWLLSVQRGDLDDEEVEPPVPPGLGKLTASLAALADLLKIDTDLLEVAAQASGPLPVAAPDATALRAWLATVPTEEKDHWLARLLLEPGAAPSSEPWGRFRREVGTQASRDEQAPARTVAELVEAADQRTQERMERAAREAKAERQRREQEAAARRQRHLDALRGMEEQLWAQVLGSVAAGKPKDYDEALRVLIDLRDLAARDGIPGFQRRLDELRQRYARRPAFLARLEKAGL